MALLLMEGFETFGGSGTNAIANLAREYPTVGIAFPIVNGRFGGRALQVYSINDKHENIVQTIRFNFNKTVTTPLYLGFYTSTASFGTFTIKLYNASNVLMATINQSLNSITGNVGSSYTLSWAGSYVRTSVATPVYAEYCLPVGTTSGLSAKFDNVQFTPSVSGTGYQNIANFSYMIIEASAGFPTIIDDLYVADTTGSGGITGYVPEAYRSTMKALTLASDGTHTQWIPSTGTTRSNLVGANPLNTANYVTSKGIGFKDSYITSAIPSGTNNINGVVHGLKLKASARKLGLGTSDLRLFTRQGSTDTEGPTVALTDSFTTTKLTFDKNPATSAPFTASQFSSSNFQVGIKTQS